MSVMTRHKTRYSGVFYIVGKGTRGGNERIYYVQYRRDGKLVEEKAGKQYRDDMTASRAARIRARRIEGKELSNRERRGADRAAKDAETGRWTLVRLWKEYEAQKPPSRSLNTDRSRFKKHIEPFLGAKEPQEIAPLDVDRVRLRVGKNRSAQTVKHVLVLLKRIVNFGVNKRLCSGLGFKVEMPTVDNITTEYLTPAQLSNLLKAISESTDLQAAHMMLMALYTGMRRGELFKLKWADIDFERNFIHIRTPKGKKSQTIPLNASARAVLESHPRGGEHVFVTRAGNRCIDMRHRINPIKEAAGLPKEFRPLHGLRHSYASMLASSGKVDLYTLQKLLTHKSPLMTQRYAHLHDQALRQASELAGEIVENARVEGIEKKNQKG